MAGAPKDIAVQDLYGRPLRSPLPQGAANIALYAALGGVAAVPAWQPLSFVVWPLMGLILAGFLATAHDCAHNTHVDGKRWNHVAGAAWCTPILFVFTAFKEAHLQHHRYTRVPGDPEHHGPIDSYGAYLRRMFLQNPLRPLLAAIRVCLGVSPAILRTPEKRRAARREARVVVAWVLLAAALTALYPRLLLAVYLGPLLFFLPALHMTALPEHHACGAGPEVLPSTRSVTTNALVRLLLWNGNYHAEHHLYPGVPSYNLPELSRRLGAVPVQRVRSYLQFHLQLIRDISRRTSIHEDA